ncbi:hypothetical protein IU449_26680 [Nocardia higoensis]|uniref:Uncharacterized protein n=1 Tax=Nocardia higoensis TaxID=228599 RepID=A0ABS0DIX5_9NOCA|nr:hypothetical protein [Nocardia higoensis]MBF6358085.1 hypothetical protein [Nocardia higoensis]
MPSHQSNPIHQPPHDHTWTTLIIGGYVAAIHRLPDGRFEYYADNDPDTSDEQWSASGDADNEDAARRAAAQAISHHINVWNTL